VTGIFDEGIDRTITEDGAPADLEMLGAGLQAVFDRVFDERREERSWHPCFASLGTDIDLPVDTPLETPAFNFEIVFDGADLEGPEKSPM